MPTAPVDAEVQEYPLTARAGRQGRLPGVPSARTKIGALGGSQVVSSARAGHRVRRRRRHLGARRASVPDDDLSFEVRTRTDGTWSDWIELPYDDDHGPDPDSAEGRHARPGTDVLLVGKVDEVQVRSTSTHGHPARRHEARR